MRRTIQCLPRALQSIEAGSHGSGGLLLGVAVTTDGCHNVPASSASVAIAPAPTAEKLADKTSWGEQRAQAVFLLPSTQATAGRAKEILRFRFSGMAKCKHPVFACLCSPLAVWKASPLSGFLLGGDISPVLWKSWGVSVDCYAQTVIIPGTYVNQRTVEPKRRSSEKRNA